MRCNIIFQKIGGSVQSYCWSEQSNKPVSTVKQGNFRVLNVVVEICCAKRVKKYLADTSKCRCNRNNYCYSLVLVFRASSEQFSTVVSKIIQYLTARFISFNLL